MSKPIHAKPSLYAFYFDIIKNIGLNYGYNIVLHGSLNRDLDIIAIPWIDDIGDLDSMIDEITNTIGGSIMYFNRSIDNPSGDKFTTKPHNRKSCIININRDIKLDYDGLISKFIEYDDPQFYIDLSIINP